MISITINSIFQKSSVNYPIPHRNVELECTLTLYSVQTVPFHELKTFDN